jgi:HK97 family phage major capsid protein
MKYRIKLKKNWTDPSGQEFKAGDVVELEDKALYAEMLADEIGEKAEPAKQGSEDAKLQDAINGAVKSAVEEAIKNAPAIDTNKYVHIELRDKSDDDPGSGYLPQRVEDKWSKDEIQHGFGLFASDVAKASRAGGQISERLSKQQERSRKIIEKAVKEGLVKAAGDGMTLGTDSEGGFLVPTEFSLQLMDGTVEQAVVRPRATKMTIGSNRVELPQLKNYDHSSNLIYGGLLAYWKGEESQLTEKKPELEQVGLTLHKLTALAYASDEIIRFSPVSLGSWLLPKMSEAIAWKEDDGFINGTGAGQPLGLINAPSKLNITIETDQTLAATAIVTNNILKMYQAVKVEKPGSLVFLYNRVDCFFWLATLTVDVGTGGSVAGLIQRVPGKPDMDLLGIPLVDTEHCQALGTVGDIMLTDLSQYIVADDRQGPAIAQSMHLKFDYGQDAFRILKYVDGQPRYKAAFTRQKSTNTMAQVVCIATRS